MLKTQSVLLALALLSSGSIANAQKTISKANTIKASATIQSIDATQRIVVLRTDKGEEDAFVLGPDVTRFNELKVGDRINFSYVESIVVTVLKPGAATSPSTAAAAVTPGTGKLPRGNPFPAAHDDRHDQVDRSVRAVGHRHDRRRTHRHAQDRRQEESRRGQGRRPARHHLYPGGDGQRRARKVRRAITAATTEV